MSSLINSASNSTPILDQTKITPASKEDVGKQHVPHSDKEAYLPYSDKQFISYSDAQAVQRTETSIIRTDYYAQEHHHHHHQNSSDDQVDVVRGGNGNEKSQFIATTGNKEGQKRPWGYKRSRFCATIAVIVVLLIIAAAIGGGIGGWKARKSSWVVDTGSGNTTSATIGAPAVSGTGTRSATFVDPTATSSASAHPTTTSTGSIKPTSTPTSTSTTLLGVYDCPAQNDTSYSSPVNLQSFKIVCDADWPNHVVGVNGGLVVDLNNGIFATSIETCVDICAANSVGGGACTAVAYGANITLALSRGGITGNCFMKTQRGTTTLPDNSGQAMAAFLTSTSSTASAEAGFGAYNCPAQNGIVYQSSVSSQNYEILCDSDWPTGIAGVDGTRVTDLDHGIYATSIEACIEICAANNAGGGACTAVAYGANATLALSRGGITGNCFMKTQRGITTLSDTSGQAIVAFLTSS